MRLNGCHSVIPGSSILPRFGRELVCARKRRERRLVVLHHKLAHPQIEQWHIRTRKAFCQQSEPLGGEDVVALPIGFKCRRKLAGTGMIAGDLLRCKLYRRIELRNFNALLRLWTLCLLRGSFCQPGRRSRHDGRRAESKENAHQQHGRNRCGSRIPQPLS